jgi:hypothetical protein
MRPTLFSLWKALDDEGGDLFAGLRTNLPLAIDPDVLIDEIMSEYGPCAPVMLQPAFLQLQITSWAKSKVWAWTKLAALLTKEYNPLENYDRTEEGTDIRTPDLQRKKSYDSAERTQYGREDTTTYGRQDTTNYGRTDTTAYGGTREDKVSAENTSTYQPNTEQINGGSDVNTAGGSDSVASSGSDHVEAGGADQLTRSGADTETETGLETRTHDLHIHGNIGVTTAQEMFEAEAQLAQAFDVVRIIAGEFADKFIIPVW